MTFLHVMNTSSWLHLFLLAFIYIFFFSLVLFSFVALLQLDGRPLHKLRPLLGAATARLVLTKSF